MSSEKSWILTNNIPNNYIINQPIIANNHIHVINGREMLYYMMLLAITALLSFPFVISQRFSKSRITITRNLFSCNRHMRKF
jgi:hypothetical protein